MKTKLMTLVAGASLCAMVGAAQAAPVELTGDQMDGVTAGAILVLIGQGASYATLAGAGNAQTIGATGSNTIVDPTGALLGGNPIVVSGSTSTVAATSVVNPLVGVGGAAASSAAGSSASLD